MREFVAQAGTLPGCGFQGDARLHLRDLFKYRVDARNHLLQSRLDPRPHVRAGMKHEKRKFKLVGAHQFLAQGTKGFLMKIFARGGEIDQVPAMPENRAEFAPLRMIEEGADFLVGKRRCEPLHVVLHEDLHRGAADTESAVNRLFSATGCGSVSAEERLVFLAGRFAFHLREFQFLQPCAILQVPNTT